MHEQLNAMRTPRASPNPSANVRDALRHISAENVPLLVKARELFDVSARRILRV